MKKINICGSEYPIDCNALVFLKYRKEFNTDIFKDINILNSFLVKQVVLAKEIKEKNPEFNDDDIIKSLSGLMLDDAGELVEAALRMAYIMICCADKNVNLTYDEWVEKIPTVKTNDDWIVEVTELAVSSFC